MPRGSAREPRLGELNNGRTHYWDGGLRGWQRLWLSGEEVAAAARESFGYVPDAVAYLGDGFMNQSWRIDTGDGAFVLRVGRPETTAEQVAYEHAFAAELHRNFDVAVAPLPGLGGSTIQHWRNGVLCLFPFVHGESGTRVDPAAVGRETAAVLAGFHRVALDRLPIRQRPGFRSVDERPRWAWADAKPTLTRELGNDARFAEAARILDREMAELDAWLDSLPAGGRDLRRATIHGDLNPRNLLFSAGTLVGVIDFDGCRLDPLAWEIAQAAFRTPGADPAAVWQAYLDAGGPLDPADAGLLGGFARMGCFGQLGWAVDEIGVRPRVLDLLGEVASQVTTIREQEHAFVR